ncbi:MAG TPA: hypothetical protein VMS76_09965 [Planctomycetota bacterium]|nr:hypothetical protein [Planctomycetota bacterium]
MSESPPPDLGRRLKEQIPDNLFAGRSAAPSTRRFSRHAGAWAAAASIAVVLGSGYLAVRLFDRRDAVESTSPAEVPDPGRAASGSRDAPRAVEAPASVAGRQRPVSGDAPDASAQRQRPAAAEAPLADATADLLDEVRGREPGRAASPDQRSLGRSTTIRELEEEKVRLEREMHALPGSAVEEETREREGDASAEPPRVRWYTEPQRGIQARVAELRKEAARDRASGDASAVAPSAANVVEAASAERSGFLDVETHPISTLAVTLGDRSLESAFAAARVVAVEPILDDATASLRPSTPGALLYEVAARAPGRVVVLLSAVLIEADGGAATPQAPSSIEITLDPAAARRYRLLASHAHALAPPTPPPAPRTGQAPLYRLAALYEIELARNPGALAGGAVGTAQVRGDAAASAAPPVALAIGTRDLGSWDAARVELRLAVLAAEIALLPADASPALLAALDGELDRLREQTAPGEATARRAAELQAILSRRAGAAEAMTGPSSGAPARDDG